MKSTVVGALSLVFSIVSYGQYNWEERLLEHYRAKEYQIVVTLADSLLSLDSLAQRARIHQIKADAYYFLNNVPASLNSYLEALVYEERYPLEISDRLECYSHAGFCYKYLGRYLEALPYYHKALTIANTMVDSAEIANQLSHLGTIYSQMGNYGKAMKYFNGAYQIDFALKDTTALAYDLVNLGDLELIAGENKKAIQYFTEGLKVKKTKAGDHTTHILRLGKLSKAFLADDQLDSAEFYSDFAISQANKMGDKLSVHKQLITEAAINIEQGNLDAALNSANRAYQYFKAEDNSYKVSSAVQLAEAQIGKGNFQTARSLLSDALVIALKNNLLETAANIYERRGELYEAMNQSKAALSDFKDYQIIRDSLQQMDKQNTILILDQEYQTSKKQQEIELLKTKDQVSQLELARKQRDNIILLILLIILVGLSAFIYYFLQRKNQLENSLLTSQVNELRLQIKAVVEGSTDSMKLDMEALNSSIEEPLSEREFEILNFAITDLSNQEIADKTFVSVNTVKYHLKNVYAKLGVSNRKEALRIAFQTIRN